MKSTAKIVEEVLDALTRHPELGDKIDAIYESDISNTDLRPAITVAAGEYVTH